MRIALDLQACQTESRWRGIGRYSLEFSKALLARKGPHEFIVGLDGTYPAEADAVAASLDGALGDNAFARYGYPSPRTPIGAPDDALRPAAEALVRQSYASLSPDVLHVNSLFEGLIENSAGLGALAMLPGTLSSVTLYDVIPALFPDVYLSDETARRWYRRKLMELSRFDVILCISEATRRDAIELLGLPPEKLFVINAGVDPRFDRAAHASFDEADMRGRLAIPGRFVLYTGNADSRKNLVGAVKAFAAVPHAMRAGTQLVLNQVGDESALRAIAESAGLGAKDLVVTGRVGDLDLAALLRTCDAFFFPSLYEGFGLPVLEAMACGAAVISADNSSLPEVIGRKDAMFDASSQASMVGALTKVLTDDGFRQSLRADAVSRASRFSWEKSAALAMDAWAGAIARRRKPGPVLAPVRRRMRVAMVTPLPPARTGIADYVRELLPGLGARMEVDLFTQDPSQVASELHENYFIRDWRELESHAASYEQVIYQFGNSPFHSYMLDLLDRVPGIAVMHDLFLSSMLAHMEEFESYPHAFRIELERSHGARAAALLESPGGRDDAKRRYPASLRLLQRADAVVVHSAHTAEVAREFYPGVSRAPIVWVPMPQRARAVPTAARRAAARKALAIPADAFLVVSLGFIADTKLVLELLAAVALVPLDEADKLWLVLVGANDGGAYGQAIEAAIDAHPRKDRIRITGFVSAAGYAEHLDAADAAVQLRADSRGETSKSVLDCMGASLPVVVNDYASFKELPDGFVAKVPADADAAAIAAVLCAWKEDVSSRRSLGATARSYVVEHHAPYKAALAYEAAAWLGRDARAERDGSVLVRSLARILGDTGDSTLDLMAIERALQPHPRSEARIFVDVSEVVHLDHGTGIHRVVKSLSRELAASPGDAVRSLGVALDTTGHVAVLGESDSVRLGFGVPGLGDEFLPTSTDALFLLDSAWEEPERFLPAISAMQAAGGRVYAMVYDLIPLLNPAYCVDYMPGIFGRWLRFVVLNCDGLVCISRTVSKQLQAWIEAEGAPHRPGLRIGHVQLGSEFRDAPAGTEGLVGDETRRAMANAAGAVLMVGTVEPRKRHDLALDAFEDLWAAGDTRSLVIIGKRGWNVDALVERIMAHPQAGHRLFWLQGLGDDDLAYAYRHAERLLQCSDAEGFGLPLVEGAHFGAPLLASNIPVFHEVAGDGADYFDAGDRSSLVKALRRPPQAIRALAQSEVRWSETARQTLALMQGGEWDHTQT